MALTICPDPIWHDWECWGRNWHFSSYIKTTSFYLVSDWLTSVRVNVDLSTFWEVEIVFSNYNEFRSYLTLINCLGRIWHDLNCWSRNWHFSRLYSMPNIHALPFFPHFFIFHFDTFQIENKLIISLWSEKKTNYLSWIIGVNLEKKISWSNIGALGFVFSYFCHFFTF